ncbi:MAG TPA: nucleoside recognition domain-containing protein, partial [Anaerolineae bacterium]
HPLWGLPILFLVLLGMYLFVGRLGAGTLVNFIEGTLFGEWVNPVVSQFIRALIPFELVQDLLVGKYGVITVALTYGFAIILPIVFTFFIAFGLLEDSGYLPRLAVMADRIFKTMGLNGKAVLPMVLGLGCDTMATMTTRTLETKKDRILVTLLLALGVPCSAQLGVVLGMLAGLDARATLIWTGVTAAVLIAVGWLAARLIPGSTSDFILELPPLRMPKVSHLAIKTLARLEWYLKEVLPLFIFGTLVLFVLDRLNVLTALERAAEPLIVNWLGLPAQATEAFLLGFLRRDYGAAGLFLMAREGLLTPDQIIVALVTITLFVPCIANFFVMVKERGLKTALAITAFIFPFAFFIGGLLNSILRLWN